MIPLGTDHTETAMLSSTFMPLGRGPDDAVYEATMTQKVEFKELVTTLLERNSDTIKHGQNQYIA